jgi:HAD superfamily hydrolase (TIGR01509 family)
VSAGVSRQPLPPRRGRYAVIFDLDGVLIDSEGLQHEAYSVILERYGVRVSIAEYAEHWIAAGRGPEHAVETYRLPLSPDEMRSLKNPVYHEILRRKVMLMPGVIEALERLSGRFPLAIATNSNRDDVGFVVERFGFGRFFSAIVTRDDYSGAKPEPDAFLAAAAALGVEPSACLVVEDAYKGVIAAHRAGAAVVAVPNRYTSGNDFSLASSVLVSLDELTVPRVEEILAARARRGSVGS